MLPAEEGEAGDVAPAASHLLRAALCICHSSRTVLELGLGPYLLQPILQGSRGKGRFFRTTD